MNDRQRVWEMYSSAALNGILVNRVLPLRPDEDFHFGENMVAVVARFADAATTEWSRRFEAPPSGQRRLNRKAGQAQTRKETL